MTARGLAEELPSTEKRLFLKFWTLPELILMGGLLFLGVLILAIHLLTWGQAAWRDSLRSAEGRCVVEKLYVHQRSEETAEGGCRPEIQIAFQSEGARYSLRVYDRLTLTENQGFFYNRETAERLVKRFRVGETYPCWFLPGKPEEVILVRETTLWGWLFLTVPLSLIIFGAVGLFWQGWKRRASKEKLAEKAYLEIRFPTVPESQLINESPGTELSYRLPLVSSPASVTILTLILAILWNAISWATLFYVLSVRTDWLDLLLAILFGVIFCGTGAALFYRFFRYAQKFFRLGATILEISDHPITPERKYRLALLQNGYLFAQNYQISVVCDEIAHYRQGTDTLTNQKEVYHQVLFDKTDFLIPRGETFRDDLFLKIPLGAMHSLTTESNQIVWKAVIKIKTKKGEIQRECPLIVLPYSPDFRD